MSDPISDIEKMVKQTGRVFSSPPRDPKRIPRILAKLEKVWKKNPDLRLGQLITNCWTNSSNVLFYVEDDVLEKGLDDMEGKSNG